MSATGGAERVVLVVRLDSGRRVHLVGDAGQTLCGRRMGRYSTTSEKPVGAVSCRVCRRVLGVAE